MPDLQISSGQDGYEGAIVLDPKFNTRTRILLVLCYLFDTNE